MKREISTFIALCLSTVAFDATGQSAPIEAGQATDIGNGPTAYVLLVNGKDTDLTFIDVHALQRPAPDVDVTTVALSERAGQQVTALIPKLRAQGYRQLLIVNPFRAATHTLVVSNGVIAMEVAGESTVEENPEFYRAQQRLEVAQQRYEAAKAQMQMTANSAQQNATGNASRLLGATAIMASGINASKYADEVNRARAALAGTPRTIRTTETRKVMVPRVILERGVVAELALSLCDLQARMCGQQTIPMNDSKEFDLAAIALKSSKNYNIYVDALNDFAQTNETYFNEKLGTDIPVE